MILFKKLTISFIVLSIFLAGLLLFTGHELGSRPENSFVSLPAQADVKFVVANKIRFGYIEMGKGPLVLLLHGYPETARSWKAVQTQIAAAGYRAVAVYMRGIPPSSFANEYSVNSLGKDVIALIDALGEPSAHIVGHDWGASAVYQAAYTDPDKVDKLVAMSIPHPLAIAGDPTVLLKAPHFLYYLSPFAARQLWSHDFAHIEKIYKSWSPEFKVPASELADIKSSLRVPGAVEGALGYYRSFVSEGQENTGPPPDSQIKVPALIIYGDSDNAIDLVRFEQAAGAFSNAYEEKVLSGTGHFPQLEAPKRVAKSIVEFLKQP